MIIMGWPHIAVLWTPAGVRHGRYWHGRERKGDKGTPTAVRGVTVPCVTNSETATPEAGHGDRAKLMIVDDDPEVRIIVAEFLEDFGYQVIQAGGGAEALELLARTPDLRMMITDIRMPDMSGIELADLATLDRPGLRIILISGYFVSRQVERRFLRKPFRLRDLEAAVRAELSA